MLEKTVGWLERSEGLDRWGHRVKPLVATLVGAGRRRDLLTGRRLGHPAHPMAVMAPMSCWLASILVDLTGVDRTGRTSRRLVQVGLAAAAPAAATGLADWLDTDEAEHRVGTAHALVNHAATATFALSLLVRGGGHRRAGVGLGLVGGSLLGAAGYLGGHLAYRRGVGVDTTAFQSGPIDWSPLDLLRTPAGRKAVPAEAGGVAMVAVHARGRLHVLEDRCTHRGGPLHEGDVDGDCIRCPWHGSRFDLATGAVASGPATAPQPVYEVREGDGVDVRRREFGGLRRKPVTALSLVPTLPDVPSDGTEAAAGRRR